MAKSSSKKIIRFQRSWRSKIIHFTFAALVGIVGVITTLRFEETALQIPFFFSGEEFVLELPVFLLLFLFAIARPLVQMYDSHYEISDHHLRAYRGHLSLRLRTLEFTFEDLIGVQISQSLLDRILGTGSIEVGSKTAQIQLKIAGIYDPQYFANIISDRIDESRIADRTESKSFKSSRPSKAANTS